jgi:hypothetical protein
MSEQPIERHPLAEVVETFLREFGASRNSIDAVTYNGFVHGLLDGKRRPCKLTVLAVELHITEMRAMEPERMKEAAETIRRLGGFVSMDSLGRPLNTPKRLPDSRIQRMIEEGLLLGAGDRLIDNVPHQTYKLSSIAP